MKKVLVILSLVAFLSSFTLSAKCYHFYKDDGYKTCVKGDSFSARKKASKLCAKAKKSDCGSIASSSSSCHSNAGKCVDENGKLHRDLSGY